MGHLCENPANREKRRELRVLRELSLNCSNQGLPLVVHLILRLEERSALFVALGFESLNLLLTDEFVLQRQSVGCGPPGLLDSTVKLLDFALKTHLEIIGPPFELLGLGLKEPRVALGNCSLNRSLLLLDDALDRVRGGA